MLDVDERPALRPKPLQQFVVSESDPLTSTSTERPANDVAPIDQAFERPLSGHFEFKTWGFEVVDRSSYNANRSLVVSGMPILVIARRQSR